MCRLRWSEAATRRVRHTVRVDSEPVNPVQKVLSWFESAA